MTTVAEPIEKIPALGEDEVCHVADVDGKKGVCGAPLNCSIEPTGSHPWKGETTCTDCGKLVCPECRQLLLSGR
jgi:hypothetical protein